MEGWNKVFGKKVFVFRPKVSKQKKKTLSADNGGKECYWYTEAGGERDDDDDTITRGCVVARAKLKEEAEMKKKSRGRGP